MGALFNTDYKHLLAALRNEVVEMVFADPSFKIGKDYDNGKKRDELGSDEYLDWCYGWIC